MDPRGSALATPLAPRVDEVATDVAPVVLLERWCAIVCATVVFRMNANTLAIHA
jgi:hypothetical protein